MKNILLLLVLATLLQSCIYAISADVARTADMSVTFEAFRDDPASCRGKMLILGGAILGTTVLSNGTLIEIAQKPLDYWGKPIRTDRSGGSFSVLYPGIPNTLVYAPGTSLTVAGVVPDEGVIQAADGRDLGPVLILKEIKVWPKERQARDSPLWLDPLYDPDGLGRRE